MNTDLRRELGAAGERLAERHLNEAGYRVIDRNFRTRHGELDLIATSRSTLVFCEVKSRLGTRPRALALEMIGPDKRRRVRSMAREWLASRAPLLGSWNGQEIRFDAIGVTVGPDGLPVGIEHIPDAF
ncbi:MAG: putative endonuclease [Thermoleophilaceae bacterium]|jgi:putative endonuclease|nr:putative endonuclease [Thermoleophilaceae bacterium]